MLRPGSPVLYYIPAAPITLAATLAALAAGWDAPSGRRWLAAAAACSMSGFAATAYLLRTVNLKLFFADQPCAPEERERLLRTWYRLNGFRLVAVGGAWLGRPAGQVTHRLTQYRPTCTVTAALAIFASVVISGQSRSSARAT
ncbi:MAG: DUF1772 domain-containing protein [Streptosporangiales bacterium]|nr:DUF1772 domain-containing protein [Streptosporangiales bacterium]